MSAMPVYEPIPLPLQNSFSATFAFEWSRKKKPAPPIRVEGKPLGVSDYVLVAYAPPSTSTAYIRIEDVRSPYEIIRLNVIGYNPIFTTLHELRFPSPTFHLVTSTKGKHKGLLRVTQCVNIANPQANVYSVSCSGTGLDAMDGLGEKSDPFLIIKSPLGAVIFTTEVIPQTLTPAWNPFVLDLKQYGLLPDHVLTMECWDYDADGGHDLIGTLSVPLRELYVMQGVPYPLINPYKKQEMARYTNSGSLLFKVQLV